MNNLKEAIEGLYLAFEHYPLRVNTNPCPCCHDEDDELRIRSKPLRQLTSQDLEKFSMDVLFVWGGEEEFKHFLPRLFEICAFDNLRGLIEVGTVFAKLAHASWEKWPDSEQRAIRDFFHQEWRQLLANDPTFPGAHELLEALARADEDLDPYLHEWLPSPGVNEYRNLANLITNSDLLENKPGIWWKTSPKQWHQVREWMRSSRVRKALEDAFEMFLDEAFAEEFEEALHRLDMTG